jgi:hypothetical protein
MTESAAGPRSGPAFPIAVWLGVLGSVAFFVAAAIWAHKPSLALVGLLYLMIFADRQGCIGCVVSAVGFLVALAMCFMVLQELTMKGAGRGPSAAEKQAFEVVVAHFFCQCCLLYGAWRFSRAADRHALWRRERGERE